MEIIWEFCEMIFFYFSNKRVEIEIKIENFSTREKKIKHFRKLVITMKNKNNS